MVTKYGMTDELGPIAYGQDSGEVFLGKNMGHVKDYSEETASKIDSIVLKIVKDAYAKAESLLTDNIDKLHQIAKYLIKNEKMHSDDFEKVMNGTFEWEEENEPSEDE